MGSPIWSLEICTTYYLKMLDGVHIGMNSKLFSRRMKFVPFIQSFIHSIIHLFIHLFIHFFIFIYSFIYSFYLLFIHLFQFLYIHLFKFIYSFKFINLVSLSVSLVMCFICKPMLNEKKRQITQHTTKCILCITEYE